MRRTSVAVVVGSLLLVSCGSDDSGADAVVATDAPTTDVAAATTDPPTTDAAATTTDAPKTDAAATTTEVAVAQPAALVPEVVCRGVDGEIVFGYTNESSEPVVVEEGDANRLSGVASDADPLLTTLFAPGTVDVAFWAFPPEGSADEVVWTLIGPDGVERSAAAGPTTNPCQGVALDGGPELVVVGQTLAADGASVDVDLRLTGLDETSVCNEAFDPEPRLVVVNDGTALPTSFEPEATLTIGPFQQSPGGSLAQARVYALVLEQCSAAGVTASSWSPELLYLNYGTTVCASLDEAETLTVDLTEGLCGGLGGAGGSGLRPR